MAEIGPRTPEEREVAERMAYLDRVAEEAWQHGYANGYRDGVAAQASVLSGQPEADR